MLDVSSLYEFEGYTIDVSKYELTEKEKEILRNAIDLVNNNWSLRELSRNCGISKSTLQKDFTDKLRYISFELYQLVRKRYEQHISSKG